MAFDFKGKVFVVSGAGSGMGLATAKLLYECGANISIVDNRREAIVAALPDITGGKVSPPSETKDAVHEDDRIIALEVDVSSSAQVNAWTEATVKKFGRLDGAANLAGITSGKKKVVDITDEDWDRMMRVNLTGTFYATRAQVKAMESLKMEAASIVNTSSIYGISGKETSSDYSAAKHGVIGMSSSCAKEVGENGIRVNCIAPGIIDTRMVRSLPPHFLESHARTLQYGQALHRMAEAKEVANLIGFLLSDLSSFITGATYTIDGGQIC
ncbi:NAD(P)-binding protein [Rhizodiscina lignyota]|uniref:NAD(P)-binding protein n=1 Tax=Rhizodiscina lignyota TaxID=1504668 RepID=A0A9P4MB83_9PEZI|nr:NAD(P)-binding protein [Rhizodiscina lignyota]